MKIIKSTPLQYAHQIVPHPEDGEAAPLTELVRYHYAQAIAWHLAFAEAVAADPGGIDFPLSQYIGHAHLALLHDALAQGLIGQESADWASTRNDSESCEWIWERGVACGLNPDEIRAYEWRRKTAEKEN